jgi:hypothetical protein
VAANRVVANRAAADKAAVNRVAANRAAADKAAAKRAAANRVVASRVAVGKADARTGSSPKTKRRREATPAAFCTCYLPPFILWEFGKVMKSVVRYAGWLSLIGSKF